MKFTIETKALLQELRLLNLIQSKNKKVPILAQLRLDVGESLKLTKTDLDHTMICEKEITYAEAGSCLVNAKLLRNLVATVTDETVDFELLDSLKLCIYAGKALWTIEAMLVEPFPELPPPGQRTLNMPFHVFRDTIAKVSFAATPEQSRFTLSGIKFIVNGSMKMVATDGHRLSLATVADITGEVDTLLPLKTLNILSHFPKVEEIGIGVDIDWLTFEVENRVLMSRSLKGNFPNYEMVLPKDHTLSASFDAVAMTHALKQAFTVAKRTAITKWTFGKDGISHLTSEDYDTGQFKTSVVTNYKGDEITFGINARYLLDLCKRQSGVVDVTMKDANSPLSFTVGDDYQYVVMPLRMP